MDLSLFVEACHLLRPWWLLGLPVVALFWWTTRRSHSARNLPKQALAPHLRKALTVGEQGRRWIAPIDLSALALALLLVGAAGPTWSRVPDPLVAQTAPLVIALEVTPSMGATDVAPSRLARAKQKIRDLLELRTGGRTALVAYAGTAHRVVPMTEDPSVVQPYLDGLLPDVMPAPGENAAQALAVASEILAREAAQGAVLFVLDSLASADLSMLDDADAELLFLAVLGESQNDAGLEHAGDARVLRVTADDADVRQLDRALQAAYRRALLENSDQPWEDRAWLLAWPSALLVLVGFRRGWTMRWAVALALAPALFWSEPARADVVDWFLTKDQQAQRTYDDKKFERAAELFANPRWKAQALYRDGQYERAAELFASIDTAEAAFAQGMAHIKCRQYRDGVRAFEAALERDPGYPGAAENLEVAKRILEYIEETREQSDTGEDGGIGADDVVFDNEEARGEETQIEAQEGDDKPLSASQWMNTVDTRTSDFLRQRFAIEAAKRGGS